MQIPVITSAPKLCKPDAKKVIPVVPAGDCRLGFCLFCDTECALQPHRPEPLAVSACDPSCIF